MANGQVVEPIEVVGEHVHLVPRAEEHIEGLVQIGLDDEIWRHMPYGEISTSEQIEGWVRALLVLAGKGTDMPFAVIHRASGQIAGATRYMEIRAGHRGLEIGGTWYGAQFRRTIVNTECKYLLLRHAFEDMKCIRVQFKTDSRNERSQRALERIGAIREGTLRNHMILPGGTIRHSVYYSIVDAEWPEVKLRLQNLLAR